MSATELTISINVAKVGRACVNCGRAFALNDRVYISTSANDGGGATIELTITLACAACGPDTLPGQLYGMGRWGARPRQQGAEQGL